MKRSEGKKRNKEEEEKENNKVSPNRSWKLY